LKDWDRIKLLLGEPSGRERPLNYTTHNSWIHRVFKHIALINSKTTHAGRIAGAQWAEILVPEKEVRYLNSHVLHVTSLILLQCETSGDFISIEYFEKAMYCMYLKSCA